MKEIIGSVPPPKIFTHCAARLQFEQYKKDFNPDSLDEDYDDVRKEIAAYYDIPEQHCFFIPDGHVQNKRRTQRAFSIVILESGEKYYIDGRVPHAILLRNLQNEHDVRFDIESDTHASIHGFIDPDEFRDIEIVQEKSKEIGRPITWFVRYTVPSSSPHAVPESPIEIS